MNDGAQSAEPGCEDGGELRLAKGHSGDEENGSGYYGDGPTLELSANQQAEQ